MKSWLSSVGTARRVDGDCSVVFHSDRCTGCDGRCGVSVGGRELPLEIDLPDGTAVEVIASARDLARRALGVFGWPLGALGVAALAAERSGAGDALIVAALFGTVLALVAARPAGARAARMCRRSATPDGLRVIIRG